MAGRVQWEAQVDSNVAKLLSETKELRDQLDGIKKGNYEIKLNIDNAKLEKVISNLDKMLNSLGKGTSDFTEFENLSKQLNEIVLEVKELNKVFGGINDSGVSNLLSSIQSIDKSLSSLSEHITNVNKVFESVGKNASDNVGQINETRKATENLTEATKELSNVVSKIDFGTKNKSEAYNQLKQMADVFKKFYGNEEVMHSKAGTDAAYAYYKAYEEALKKGVAQSKLERVTVDVSPDNFHDAYTLSSDRIKDFENFKKYGGDITDLSVEILSLEGKLLDFTNAYTKVKANLGDSPITPDIIRSIEDYVELLDKARYLESFGDENDKDIISSHKDNAQFWLDDALYKAKIQNEEYTSSLKKVREEKEKVDEVITQSSTSTSTVDDSKFDELKADVTEIKEELNGVKEKISAIDSEGFEHVKADVEKTVESVKELNSELTEVKSKLDNTSTTPVETNISSPIKDTFQGDTKASAESSAPAIKDEAKAMEQVAESAEKASKSKDEFAKANKKVKESADSSSKAVSEEATEFNKIIGKLDGYQKKLDSFKVKPTDGHRYPIYHKNINELNEYIDKLQTLSQKDINLIKKEDVSEAQALQKEIDELIFKMSKMSASEKGFDPLGADKALEKINSELKKNSAMSKEAKRQIQAFYDEIRSGNPSKPIKDLLDDMYKLIQAERLAGREGKSFMDIFKEKVVYGAAANMAGMIGIYDIINVGREGITVIRELDTALTEMRKVSDETVSSLERFQYVSFDLADDVGTTAKQIQNSTADYMRLGESLDEATESARVANILLNVSEFDNIDDATSSLVSMGQAYKDLDKIEIVDKLNEVGEQILPKHTVMYGKIIFL